MRFRADFLHVAGDDVHAEGECPDGGSPAGSPQADDAERLFPHRVLGLPRPVAGGRLAVLVEPRPEFATMNANDRRNASQSLAHAIKTFIGVSADVRVVNAGTIERSIGKAKRVIDKRKA